MVTKLKLIDAREAKWCDADKTCISVKACWDCKNDEDAGYNIFIARADDCEEHGCLLFHRLVEGEFGKIQEYVPPTKEEINKYKLDAHFMEIKRVLKRTNDTQVEDYDPDLKREWREFRKTLKDIYSKLTHEYDVSDDFPTINWPQQPDDIFMKVVFNSIGY